MPNRPINPALSDMLQSALQKAAGKAPAPRDEARVVVNGDHNIISYGGQVHVTAAVCAPAEAAEL